VIRVCPECHTPMNEDTFRCPHCGRRFPNYEISFMLIGLGIIIIVISVLLVFNILYPAK
jgi:RNA polymerase subunit RPABC4/transcription elongation factor Spt4